MSGTTFAGVLRTVPQQAMDERDRFGGESSSSWDVIPGVKVRNDGVYPATLVPGYVYRIEHDGTAWQLTPEGERHHAYLVDAALEPIGRLELAHRPIVLMRGSHYTLSQDEAGAWRLCEHTLRMVLSGGCPRIPSRAPGRLAGTVAAVLSLAWGGVVVC
jgi:hypothetical protein